MSALAKFIARWIWWWCLWLMRRPWMKALQRRSRFLYPPSARGRATEALVRQNRFARRHGVSIISFVIQLFFAYAIVMYTFVVALSLYEDGFFALPPSVAHRVGR